MQALESDLIVVDLFLESESKELNGPQPDWVKSGFDDWQVSWPIMEIDSGLIRSSLKLRIPLVSYQNPSVGVVFRKKMVARIDRANSSECEANPPYAQRLGLPGRVCGPHVHHWADNRAHVALTGKWELPTRRPILDNMTRINQMFFWFCDEIRVKIPKDYRILTMPDRGLFDQPNA